MKILFLTEVYHPTINGVVVAIDSIARQLRRRGHQVYILAPHHGGYLDDNKFVYRVPSLPVGKKQDYYFSFPNKTTFEIVRMIQPDIIHSHHIWLMARFGLHAARRLKTPFVLTYHTYMEAYAHKVKVIAWLPGAQKLLQALIRHQSRVIANQSQLVISPSFPMKKILRRYGIQTPIEVLPTGIDINQFNFHQKSYLLKKHQIQEASAKLLLFVGRLAFEKNIQMLLTSFCLIHQKLPHTYLILVGDGPQKKFYQQKIRAFGLDKYVIFTGFIPPEETKKYFGSADLFLFPSITDTQASVILEAMAGGCVPVAVNQLGPTDIINSGYNGFLTPNNPVKFSQAAIRLLTNPRLKANLRARARKKALHFTIERQVDKLISFYQNLS